MTESGTAVVVDPTTHQGDYVPAYTPGAIAAGGPAAPAEKPAVDHDRARHLVPTRRQLEHGAEEIDVSELEESFRAPAAEESAPRRSRKERVGEYMHSVNPWKIEGPKIVLAVIGVQALMGGWDEQVLSIAMPEIVASFGIDLTTLVRIESLMGTALIALGLPIGYLVDRVKRVRLFRIASVAGQIGTLLQVFAPTFGVYSLGRLGSGAVTAPGGAAAGPLMADYFPSRSRARVLGFRHLMITIGGLISLPIVGYMIKVHGWRPAVLILAAPSLVAIVLTFMMKEPVRGAMDRMEMGVSAERAAVEQAPPSFGEAVRAAWGIRTIRYNMFADFFQSMAKPMGLAVTFVSISEYALDPFERSLMGWGFHLVALPLLFVAIGMTQRFLLENPKKIMVLAATVAMIGSFGPLVLLLRPPLWVFILVGFGSAMVPLIVLPAVSVVKLQAIPARYRGLGLQIDTPLQLIALSLTPVMFQASLQLGLRGSIVVFAPFLMISAILRIVAGASVSADIRAARAAALAEEESARAKAERQNKILVCRDLDVLIDEVQVLTHVDLDVREGEIVALVGTNGAGKSTLLRAICGLQPAANGAVFYDGIEVTFRPTHEHARDGLVYMPGGQGVFPLMTVRENLTSAAWVHRKESGAVEAGIEQVLEQFPRLRERLDAAAGSLSGGEQQMLAVGQALLLRPRLLMIDELSLGLAPAVVEQLLDTLRELRASGTTVILVEQSLNVALIVADRAVFMESGEIRFDGPTEDLLARPELVRAVFMGGAGGGAVTASRKRSTTELDEPEALLTCDGLSVALGGVQALQDVSLEVAAGEVVGIIGPNGAGKTTLFDVISGYLAPDDGVVYLGEHDITATPPDERARMGLGRAFQNARLFPPLTVRENIAVALDRRAVRSALLGAVSAPRVRRSERKIASRVDGFIELLGLGAYADKFIRELSTGTRRAVEVACQMAAEPKMLLLDEPSSGLAQAEVEALGPALERIVRETGCGMLVVEHDLTLISRVSDRLVAMELGEVIATGTPGAVVADPRVLRGYLAASSDVIDRSGSRVGAVLETITSDLPTQSIPDHPGSDSGA